MLALHCGRCGLRITVQAPFLTLENCPRCLARSAIVVPMAVTGDRGGSSSGKAPMGRRALPGRRPAAGQVSGVSRG